MTLTAVDPVANQRYYAPAYTNPRDEIPFAERLICPIANVPVICVKQGHRLDGYVSAHFRRPSRSDWPSDVIEDSEYRYNGGLGESRDHLLTKDFICHGEGGVSISPYWDFRYATTELRIFIPSKNRYRIADVALDNPVGGKLVVEVQYSPITIHELQERTDDYTDAGWNVQWVFGPKNQSESLYLWHENALQHPAGVVSPSNKAESQSRQVAGNNGFNATSQINNYQSGSCSSIRNPTQTQVALL
jgi:hypothetical protein